MKNERIRRIAAWAAVLLLAGCAAQTGVTGEPLPPDPARTDVLAPVPQAALPPSAEEAFVALEAAERALEASVAAEGGEPCEALCGHVARMCELAAHICTLTAAHPDEVDATRCPDATARCSRAREAVAARCACAGG